jgi:DNA binding domain, excisionase family
MDEMLTTLQVAERLGVTAGRVRQMIVDGQLPAVKLGRDNFIKASDLKLVKDRKVGRPPKAHKVEKESGERLAKRARIRR